MAEVMAPPPFEGLTPGGYRCIYADPPWRFRSFVDPDKANRKDRRDAGRHYRTMTLAEIEAMPVKALAARDCHLFLWVTSPFLVIGAHLPIIRAWGFKPSALAFTWIKEKASMRGQIELVSTADLESALFVNKGLTTRKNAEFCVLARRGNARRLAKDVREVILDPVRQHSRKPDEARRRIERYCEGPRLELFARERAPGWDSFGNEVGKFEVAA